jgi:N-methylhydantoinase A
LFSAFGLLLADTEHHLSRSISSRGLTPDVLQMQLAGLLSEGERRLEADGFTAQRREARISATARYAGQSSDIVVPLRPGTAAQIMQDLPEAFAAEHEKLYGFRAPPGEPVEITGLALLARGIPTQNRLPLGIPPSMPNASGHRPAWFDGIGWTATPIVSRGALTEFPRAGPMIVQEYDATCVVPPGCSAVLDGFGNIRLSIG